MEHALATYFLYWICYAFLGWVVETVYCSVIERRFKKCGFLNGPVVPIYAFGAFIILYFLQPFTSNPVAILFFGMVLTTFLEYLTSLIMEKLFGLRWWDYSHEVLNIHGRVCLKYSVMFGILCLIVVYWIQPHITQLIVMIPKTLQDGLALVLFIAVVIDLIFSTITTLGLQKKIQSFNTLKANLKAASLDGSSLNERFKHERQQLMASFKRSEKRLLQSFPTINRALFETLIEDFKANVRKYAKRRK